MKWLLKENINENLVVYRKIRTFAPAFEDVPAFMMGRKASEGCLVLTKSSLNYVFRQREEG